MKFGCMYRVCKNYSVEIQRPHDIQFFSGFHQLLREVSILVKCTACCQNSYPLNAVFNLDRMLLYAKYIPFDQVVVYFSSFHFYSHQSCPCYEQLRSKTLPFCSRIFLIAICFDTSKTHYLIRRLQRRGVALIMINIVILSENKF